MCTESVMSDASSNLPQLNAGIWMLGYAEGVNTAKLPRFATFVKTYSCLSHSLLECRPLSQLGLTHSTENSSSLQEA